MLALTVLSVHGRSYKVTDGKSVTVLDRSQIDNAIIDKKITIAGAIRVHCIDKIKNKHDVITHYVICEQSKPNNRMTVEAGKFKDAFKQYKIICDNLKLTQDNKIIDMDTEVAKPSNSVSKTQTNVTKAPVSNNVTPKDLGVDLSSFSDYEIDKIDSNRSIVYKTNKIVIDGDKVRNIKITMSDLRGIINRYGFSRSICANEKFVATKDLYLEIINKISNTYACIEVHHSVNDIIISDKINFANVELVGFKELSVGNISCRNLTLLYKEMSSFRTCNFDCNRYNVNLCGDIKCINTLRFAIKAVTITKDITFEAKEIILDMDFEKSVFNGVLTLKCDKLRFYDNEQKHKLKELLQKGCIKIHTNFDSPAMRDLLNLDIQEFELDNEEDKLKIEQMKDIRLKENVIGTTVVSDIYTACNEIYNNAKLDFKVPNNLCAESTLSDESFSILGMQRPNESNDIYKVVEEAHEMLCKASPNIAKYINDNVIKSIQMMTNISIKMSNNLYRFNGVAVGVLELHNSNNNKADLYAIITNSVGIVYFGLLADTFVDLDEKRIELDAQIYDIFNVIKGINKRNILQYVSTTPIAGSLEYDIRRLLVRLVNRTRIYFKKNNIAIIKTGDNWLKLNVTDKSAKYDNLLKKNRTTGYNITEFSCERVDTNEINKVFAEISSYNYKMLEKSLIKNIITNSTKISKQSDEELNIKEQKVSTIWQLSRELKVKLFAQGSFIETVETFTLDEVYKMFSLPFFAEIKEKEYKQELLSHRVDNSFITSAWSIDALNERKKSIKFGEYMYFSAQYIEFIDNVNNVKKYFVSSIRIRNLIEKLQNLNRINSGLQNPPFGIVYSVIPHSDARMKYMNQYKLYNGQTELNCSLRTAMNTCGFTEIFTTEYCSSNITAASNRRVLVGSAIYANNKTGYLYCVHLIVFLKSNGEKPDVATRFICRIPDLRSALHLVKDYEYDAYRRNFDGITAPIARLDQFYKLDRDLEYLQRNNVAEKDKYISNIDINTFNNFKNYISYEPDQIVYESFEKEETDNKSNKAISKEDEAQRIYEKMMQLNMY